MSLPLPATEPDRGPTHVTSLVDTLETERRLLDELARVLVAQREGIAADDLLAVDESVFAANRLFRTLQEARQRRKTLLQLVGAGEELPLRELDKGLGLLMSPEVGAARDRLIESAESLARELSVNRQVIGGALAVGEKLLEIFIGGAEQPTLYDEGAAPRGGGGSGAIVNTRV